jgi:hypothetical protein
MSKNHETVYQLKGYKNRKEYLQHLADEYDCTIGCVKLLADIFGKEEDFDGLVMMLRDYEVIINERTS